MRELKQNTATNITVGPFLARVDGVTPGEGLTITPSDVMISRNGNGFVQKSEPSNATDLGGGNYSVALNTTDMTESGSFIVQVNINGYSKVFHRFTVSSEDYYGGYAENDLEPFKADLSNGLLPDDFFSEPVEESITLIQLFQAWASAFFGKSSKAGAIFRSLEDIVDRIVTKFDKLFNREKVDVAYTAFVSPQDISTTPVMESLGLPQSNEYMEIIPDGRVVYTLTVTGPRDNVFIDGRIFTVPIFTNLDIKGTEKDNGDGTFSYSHVSDASLFLDGYTVSCKFSYYDDSQPTEYSPGPTLSDWSSQIQYFSP